MTSKLHQSSTAKASTAMSSKRPWCALKPCVISSVSSMPKSGFEYLDRQPRLQTVRTFAAINLEAGS